MRHLLFSLLLFVSFSGLMSSHALAEKTFPSRPVKIIVYTNPGGAVDVFARKFTAIAERISGNTFVIVNKPGAGGILALKDLLNSRNDGYTLAAVTKSNIGKMVSSGSSLKLERFEWLTFLESDPEAIITSDKQAINSWNDLLKDKNPSQEEQLWLGPESGGNDHVTALKIWKATGIKAKWIPYSSGGDAFTALLGNHGSVYVGNPGDTLGRPNLKILAISNSKRLGPPFQDIPTLGELGFPNLDNEIMWRGFIGKSNMPAAAKDFYLKLFAKVLNDPEWQKYVSERGAEPKLLTGDDFLQVVKADWRDFSEYSGLSKEITSSGVAKFWGILFVGLLLISLVVTPPKIHFRKDGYLVGALVMMVVYILLLSYTGYFIATGLFIIFFPLLLKERHWTRQFATASIWCAFAYFVFVRFLALPLPQPEWFQ